MTRADTLTRLADRVEGATGADRGLDAAVWWHAAADQAASDGDLIERFNSDPAKGLDYWCGMGWRSEWQFPPRYTASLDAAMGLVPDGLRVLIDSDGCHCRITDPRSVSVTFPWDGVTGFAGTMPQALTAAALRAHAALDGAAGEGE